MNAEGVLPNWRLGCFKWANCCTACTHPSNVWGWSCLEGSAGLGSPSLYRRLQEWWGGERLFITPSPALLLYSSRLDFAVCPYSLYYHSLWCKLFALVEKLVYFSGPSDSVWDSFNNNLQFFSFVFSSCFHFCSLLLAVGLVKRLANAFTFTFSPTVSGLHLSFWLSEPLQCQWTGSFCIPLACCFSRCFPWTNFSFDCVCCFE